MATLAWIHRINNPDAPHIVLLHGFGANMHDLADLGEYLDPRRELNWHYPQAPIELASNSHAWFPRRQRELEMAASGALWSDLSQYDSDSIDTALQQLHNDMAEIGIAPESLIIGGFSQGSMLALLAGLTVQARGILLWSSALFAQNRLQTLLQAKPLPPVFQSHGSYDPVLPLTGAVQLRQLLRQHGKVTWYQFEGMHQIDSNTLQASSAFISQLIAGQPPQSPQTVQVAQD